MVMSKCSTGYRIQPIRIIPFISIVCQSLTDFLCSIAVSYTHLSIGDSLIVCTEDDSEPAFQLQVEFVACCNELLETVKR